MVKTVALIPFFAITAIHLVALAVGADLTGDITQVFLMPALALGFWLILRETGSADAPIVPWMLAGLFFSWLGDSIPRLLDGDAAFLAMIGGFLIAQICYTKAFWPYLPTSIAVRRRAWLVVYIGAAAGLIALCLPEADGLWPAVIVYGIVLTAMGVAATGLNLLTWLGGAIFMASDALIALDAFDVWTQPGHNVWVMTTYCGAQLLLVYGVVRLNSLDDRFTDSRSRAQLA